MVVSDTAGIREAAGKVEQEGIRRTLARAQAADLVLWLVDVDGAAAPAVPADVAARPTARWWWSTRWTCWTAACCSRCPDGAIGVSALTGDGLDRLTRRLAAFARARIGDDEAPALTQARHRQQLRALPGGARVVPGLADGGVRAARRGPAARGRRRWGGSRARWMWRRCWARFSGGSVSGSRGTSSRLNGQEK